MDYQSSLERAWAFVQRQQYELALQEASSAISELPDSSVAHGVMAYCLFRKGQFDEAKEFAWQAVRRNPNESGAHYVLAEAFITERNLTEAEKHLRISLSVKPDCATYLEALGRILNSTRREEEAIAIANEILRRDSESVEALNLRAAASFNLRRLDDSNRDLLAALSLDPNDPRAHTRIGMQLMLQRRFDRAIEHFQDALRIEPSLETAQHCLKKALECHSRVRDEAHPDAQDGGR